MAETHISIDIRQIFERVQRKIEAQSLLQEKRMFGGATLMLNNNMLCSLSKKGLMVRVGVENESGALKLKHTRPCDGAGHRMPGFVMIDPLGLVEANNWQAGLDMAIRYVAALPSKVEKVKANSLRPKV